MKYQSHPRILLTSAGLATCWTWSMNGENLAVENIEVVWITEIHQMILNLGCLCIRRNSKFLVLFVSSEVLMAAVFDSIVSGVGCNP